MSSWPLHYVNLMSIRPYGPHRPLSLHNGAPLGHYLYINTLATNLICKPDVWQINYLYLLYSLQVHLKSQFIMNGVCVMWKGWIDLQRLDGAGYLEFDHDRARVCTTLCMITRLIFE